MDSRVTYQNISPEVTRKPWRVKSPDAEGIMIRMGGGMAKMTSLHNQCNL